MNSLKIFYWITTLLFAAQVLYDAVLDLMPHQQAVAAFTKMGMPVGMLVFYGMVKLVTGIVILLPFFKAVKEWAYAILIFSVLEATYAMASSGQPPAIWGLMAVPFLLGILSYIFWKLSNRVSYKTTTERITYEARRI